MYGVKIYTPTCCWVLGLQYTCKAKTRCGGSLWSSRCEAKWIRVGEQEKHHMMLQTHIMTTAAAKVRDGVVYGTKLEHCLHFDNLSSFVHSHAIERKDNIKENINLFLRKWHFIIGNKFLFAKQILLKIW